MLTWLDCTLREWIAGEIAGTNTHRCVAHHTTLGIGAARAFTWIFTFLIYTRQMRGTLAVANTLRSTIRWQA